MSIDTQKFTTGDIISIPFGMRLKSAREARGLESKDVAAQLRLSERMIAMIEKETYPVDLPVTFVRGYIRAYARLMEIPDSDINKALEPIKPLPTVQEEEPEPIETEPVTSGNYFMQFFTYLIFFTIIGLVGVWWYSHSAPDNHYSTEIPITEQHTNQSPGNAVSQSTNNASTPQTASNTGPEALAITNNGEQSANTNNSFSTALDTAGILKAEPVNPTDFSDSYEKKPESLLAIRMIYDDYSIEFFTHLILFLFIGFVMLWEQNRALLDAEINISSIAPTPFDPALNLEMIRTENAPFILHRTPRNKREIKRTMRILSTLVLLSLISLTGMWWYTHHPIFTDAVNTHEILSTTSVPTLAPSVSTETSVLSKTETKVEAKEAESNIKNAESIPIEKAEQVGKNIPVQPQVKQNEATLSTSGKYSPVPVTNKVSSKHHRRQEVVSQVEPLEDDFSELDDDNL